MPEEPLLSTGPTELDRTGPVLGSTPGQRKPREKPQISFVVIAFQQERYAREAVTAALAQDHPSLEVILSDDCSMDGTFERMSEAVAAYDGDHAVLLNRTERNAGLAANLNDAIGKASGEIIVVAAGDDVSAADRASKTWRRFLDSGRTATAIFSDMIQIDSDGRTTGAVLTRPRVGFDRPREMCARMLQGVTGASAAYHRRVFEAFGPLMPEVVFEDRVLAFRSALLGRIEHIPEPLVRYRRHGGNTVGMFHSDDLREARRTIECFLWAYRNAARDLERFIREVCPDFDDANACRRTLERRVRKLEAYLAIHSGGLLPSVRGVASLGLNGGNPLRGLALAARVARERASRRAG